MFLAFLLLTLLNKSLGEKSYFYATKGEVWPRPDYENKGHLLYSVYINDESKIFKFNVTNHDCQLIQHAIDRCKRSLKYIVTLYGSKANNDSGHQNLTELRITLRKPCEHSPQHGMDESYSLVTSQVSELTSDSVWGIIRGLETFTQLLMPLSLSDDNPSLKLRSTIIVDKPYYPYRGLLMDCSRHYVPVIVILNVLRAMSLNKMNVFHWRLVDEYSLSPVNELPTVPYSKRDIAKVVECARIFGIRVMPELGLPLHAGPKNPSSELGGDLTKHIDRFHPLYNKTYSLIKKLYEDMQPLFLEKYLHLGEVDISKWVQDERIKRYVEGRETNIYTLHKFYLGKVGSVLRKDTTPVIWQSDKLVEASLPENFIIQKVQSKKWLARGVEQLKEGRQVICSVFINEANFQRPLQSRLQHYYREDPRTQLYEVVKDHTLDGNVLGIDAIWEPDEMEDYSDIFTATRTWLYITTIAEVQWSLTSGKMAQDTFNRLAEQDCRLVRALVHEGNVEHCTGFGDDEEDEDKNLGPVLIFSNESSRSGRKDETEWGLLMSSLTSKH